MNEQRRHAVAALVNRLLSHYRVEGDSPTVTKDWIDDLSEFDAEVVADACREWRRSSTRRPVIAEIRSRCREIATASRTHPKPAWDRDAFAKAAGFASWAERQDAIEQQQQRYAMAEAERQKWREAAE